VSDRTLKTKLKETNTLIVALPYNELRKNMINSDMFDLLPDGSSFINISDSKIIDNVSLLEAINSGKIEHATVDNLSSTFRDELIATGKVSYTKSNAWKFNYDIDRYIGSIKEHVKALKEDKPVGVVLDRIIKKVNAFWA
jgi:lactate dehydrogenase-like 2-hydroxyacid dehydrogenase